MEKQLAGNLTLVPNRAADPHPRIPSTKGQTKRLTLARDQGASEDSELRPLRPAESEPLLQTHHGTMGEGALAPIGLFEDTLAYSIDREQDPWRASTKSLNKGWMRKFFVKRSKLAGPSQGKRLKSAYPGRPGGRSTFSLGAHEAKSEKLDQYATSHLAAKEGPGSRNYKSGL